MRATVSILTDLGCPDEYARPMAHAMREKGIVFSSQGLADAIAEIVDHPGRRAAPDAAEEGGS